MENRKEFELAIIGAGPGGYVAAIRAAQLGLKTALVEKEPALGGTCLTIGCIPSKALLASSHHFDFARHGAAEHGVLPEKVHLDLGRMMDRKGSVVRRLTQGIDGLMRRNGVSVFHGTGHVAGPGRVELTHPDGTAGEIGAKHIILATGSVPAPLAGLEFNGQTIVSSTEALSFNHVPERLIVVGAGAIGLELGSVWNRLGSKVTVLEFLPRIAPGFDAELAAALHGAIEKQGLEIHLEARVTGVDFETGKPRVHAWKGGEDCRFEADRVLVAVGRQPFLGGVLRDGFRVDLDDRGRVVVDRDFRTSAPGIYAIGDIVAGPMLAHKAEEDGIACVERIAGRAGHVNYSLIPNVIYTHPEAASVGLGEEDARKSGRAIRVGKFPFLANGRALANGDTQGMVKLIADAETDRLLGAHILSPAASELIAEAVSVMEFHGSAEDVARTIHAHPTLGEALKEAALAVDGRAIHL